jgi:hypothetical protein
MKDKEYEELIESLLVTNQSLTQTNTFLFEKIKRLSNNRDKEYDDYEFSRKKRVSFYLFLLLEIR